MYVVLERFVLVVMSVRMVFGVLLMRMLVVCARVCGIVCKWLMMLRGFVVRSLGCLLMYWLCVILRGFDWSVCLLFYDFCVRVEGFWMG